MVKWLFLIAIMAGCGQAADVEPEELASVVVGPSCPVGHEVYRSCPMASNCSVIIAVANGPDCHINYDLSCTYGTTGVTSRQMIPLSAGLFTVATVDQHLCFFSVAP